MSNIAEKQITIAAKLYRARDTMKRFWGDRYFEQINLRQEDIRKMMAKLGLDELKATMKMVEMLQQYDSNSGMTQAIFLAAYVEMIEPS